MLPIWLCFLWYHLLYYRLWDFCLYFALCFIFYFVIVLLDTVCPSSVYSFRHFGVERVTVVCGRYKFVICYLKFFAKPENHFFYCFLYCVLLCVCLYLIILWLISSLCLYMCKLSRMFIIIPLYTMCFKSATLLMSGNACSAFVACNASLRSIC